jgi:predicted aldo/keto reductase-like oxidoreductase
VSDKRAEKNESRESAAPAATGFEAGRRRFLKAAGVAAAGIAAQPLMARLADAAAAADAPAGSVDASRMLGKTGFRVATIGFGAMTTRDSDVIRYAIDKGVDYVDTADCYMGGENERIVGRALEGGYRQKVVLATKVHIAPPEKMIASVENSLRSLKVDAIDIMQLHGISSEAEVLDGNAREAMSKLLAQGKIKVAGVTTHKGQEAVLRAVMKHGFYKTVLVSYNFRSDEALTTAVREAGAAGVGVIGMKTQAGGYPVKAGSALSPHAAALAWVLANPGMATTIPGMTSFAQVDENLAARGKRFGWLDRKALARYEALIGDRHCTLCGACDGLCPNGVDVPSALRALTYREGYGEEALARQSYRSIGAGRSAAACGSCGRCAVRCRVALDVRSLARRAHAALA